MWEKLYAHFHDTYFKSFIYNKKKCKTKAKEL